MADKAYYWTGEGNYRAKDGSRVRFGEKLPDNIDAKTLKSMISKGNASETPTAPTAKAADISAEDKGKLSAALKEIADSKKAFEKLTEKLTAAESAVAELTEKLAVSEKTVAELTEQLTTPAGPTDPAAGPGKKESKK